MDAHRARVLLPLAPGAPNFSATSSWEIDDADGVSRVEMGRVGEAWRIERSGGALVVVSASGARSPLRPPPLVVRGQDAATLLTVNGRRYRGELRVAIADSGIIVVNRLSVEDYLRGVVPLEMGPRVAAEHAALEAQAVAARSYAYAHMADGTRHYDLVASTRDQVYGGVDAESSISDAAVAATSGLVLMYEGRIANAAYHAVCGGRTAAASEVWRSGDQPYLASVSDQIPGSDRFYCDIAPRFRWTRTLDRDALAAALDRYLAAYAALPAGRVGTVQTLAIDGVTPSGRARAVAITTSTGRWLLRGNDVRYVLRAPGSEILASTYFTLESERDDDGAPRRVILRGQGNGHGVGMCQWGAIGRARAGQNYQTILLTYYPGTTIAALD